MNTRERRQDRARIAEVTELVARILMERPRLPGCFADKPGWHDALHQVVRDDKVGHYTVRVLVAIGRSDLLRDVDHVPADAVRDLARIASGRVRRYSIHQRRAMAATGARGYLPGGGQQPEGTVSPTSTP